SGLWALGSGLWAVAKVCVSGTAAPFTACKRSSVHLHDHFVDRSKAESHLLRSPFNFVVWTQFHRPCRIRRPFAPRPRIQLRAVHAGVFHREQVVARRDSRAAVTDDAIGAGAADGPADPIAHILRRTKRSLFVHVPLKEMIHRARNMTRLLVDRFRLATISLGGASIEEPPVPPAEEAGHLSGVDDEFVARRGAKLSARRCLDPALCRPILG